MIKPVCFLRETQGVTKFESEQYEYPYKWEKNPITYSVIRGTEDLPGDTKERLAVNLAMTTWDIEIKPTLKWVRWDEEPDITIEFCPAKDDELFSKQKGILAYAYFPQTSKAGVIVFNDDYHWGMKEGTIQVTNPDGSISVVKVFNLLHTLTHEIGHSLGLTHDEDTLDSIMYPFYNAQINLVEDDIRRIGEKYGATNVLSYYYKSLKRWLAIRKVRF